MTSLLEQAISAVQALPEADQDMIASIIMAELADQERSNYHFDETQPQLAKLAEKVRADIRAGRVRTRRLRLRNEAPPARTAERRPIRSSR
jgi:hypothetical protein